MTQAVTADRTALLGCLDAQRSSVLAIVTDLDAVLHLVEETARHAGHLDIARELLDGRTGLGPR